LDLTPDELRLPPAQAAALTDRSETSKRLPRHRPDAEFLKGPIPLAWLAPAARLLGRALAVALSVWFESGRKAQRTVHLTGPILARFGVSRKALYHGLRALEAAGLVSVERRAGKNPTVTILDPPTPGGRPESPGDGP
jgi:hypothetical protein